MQPGEALVPVLLKELLQLRLAVLALWVPGLVVLELEASRRALD